VLTFNAANELTSGNGASYLYDAYHRLVKKTQSGVPTYSVYDHSGTLLTQYKSGTYTDFIKLGKQTVAEIKAGVITYQHSDVLGSPIAESNGSATITKRFHYKPFGERMETFATDDTGYTGHQFDQALGLTYMQQRYYDPLIGRFYSVDPIGYTNANPVMSFNRYLYVNDNPYKYKDPDGKFIWHAVGAVVGGAVNAYVQHKTTGKVDLTQVAVAAAFGAAGVGLGSAVATSVAGAGFTGTAAVAANIAGNTVGGAVLGAQATVVSATVDKIQGDGGGTSLKEIASSAKAGATAAALGTALGSAVTSAVTKAEGTLFGKVGEINGLGKIAVESSSAAGGATPDIVNANVDETK
jgi:RHS repeat-associated protein